MSNSAGPANALASTGVFGRPVREAEVVPALQMILGSDGCLAEPSQAAELMKYTAQRGINLADIWVAESDGRVRWAALPVVSPGRTVLFFGTSASLVGSDVALMHAGVESVSRHYATMDIQMAQVLLDPADHATRDVYLSHNFKQMAELLYLQKSIRRAAMPQPLAGDFELLPYSAQTHAGFAAAILASYEASLDCPPLNGLRGIEDIIAGHKAAGIFDPNDWFLLLQNNQPVAVLLLSMTHQADGMELVYLGLVPGARGLGIGDYLMRVSEARVIVRKVRTLSLAVDAVNTPALKLYFRHGMHQITAKIALMRMFDSSAENC